MKPLLVAGSINIETTLRIDQFPLPYFPVTYAFGRVNSTVAGVGYNLTKALHTLGEEVRFLSMIGSQDLAAEGVRLTLQKEKLPADYVLPLLDQTLQSVIIYDESGRRQIHVDLKHIQESTYPDAIFRQALEGCGIAVLCNINFARAFLPLVLDSGIPIATDVHAISQIDDPYNADFMRAATILFMSHENLPTAPDTWARHVQNTYGTEIIVIGMGSEGAFLAVRRAGFFDLMPAVYTRPIVSTIGAGDALFASFLHAYYRHADPYAALQKALVFASYKIGVAGAADGFLDESSLEEWVARLR